MKQLEPMRDTFLYQQMEEMTSFKNVLDCGGRGTFVGTPLYVAPEMIAWSFSGPFTDLWALGCIIY